MLSAEEQSEYEAACRLAWKGTSSTSVAAHRLGELLDDGVQAQRTWAEIKLQEVRERGLADLAKRAWRSWLPTRAGSIALIAGVRSKGQYVQLPLPLLNIDQLRETINVHTGHLRASRRNIAAYKRLLKIYEQNPQAKNADDACRLAGVELSDILAGRVAA